MGRAEFDLIAAADFLAFPPRLDIQPIFYPVTTLAYAEEIARRWNTKDAVSAFCGYALEFDIEAEWIARYPVQTVGSSAHQELWVPAEDLADFNSRLVGPIRVVSRFNP